MPAVLHHVRPEPGVTEIRVHGVGGTPPEALLEQTGVRQVAGDDKAGIFRGAVQPDGRTVEAYSWGGLTARSRSRAFWVVLLPFSLVNLAGWMVEPPRDGTLERSTGTKWHEACVQVIAVLTTAAYVMAAALVSMNTVALQCGGIPECRSRWVVLRVFGRTPFADHPGRRVLLGLLVPLALLLTFFVLSVVSSRRYDDYGDPVKDVVSAPDEAGESVIGLPDFWYPSQWQRHVARLHLAAPLLVLAALLGQSALHFEETFDHVLAGDPVPDAVASAVFTVSVLALVALVAGLLWATWRGGERLLVAAGGRFGAFTRAVLAAAFALLGVAAWLTWRLDVPDSELVTQRVPSDPLFGALLAPENRRAARGNVVAAWDLWGFGWAPLLLLGVAAAFIGLFSVVQTWRWFVWRMLLLDQFVVVLMIALVMLWQWAVPISLGAAAFAAASQWTPPLVARWRPAAVATEGPALWRLWIFLGVCGLAAVTRIATASVGHPYGVGWPRLTPVLLFTVVLTALIAGSASFAMSVQMRRVVATIAVPAVVLVAGAAAARFADRPSWFYGATWLAWVALAVVWLASFRFGPLERRWRWNGPAAVATLALSLLLGVFSGVLIRLVDVLDGDGETFALRATAFYEWTVIGFAGVVLVLAVGTVIWYLSLRTGLVVSDEGRRVPKVETICEAIRAVDVVVTMAALLLVASLTALVAHLAHVNGDDFARWIDTGAPNGWGRTVRAASWVAVGTAVLALVAIRRGLRDRNFRARVGILWDLATFWPRTFHPFAPPAYATRAVPELQARLAEVVNATQPGPDGSRQGAAILSGHSQGSILSVAAVASLKPEIRRRVVLVTHGSPLERFYRRYFPRYFPPALFDHCASSLAWAEKPGDGGWLNFWRPSDPICDPVFDGRDRPRSDGKPPGAVLQPLLTSGSGAAALPDVRLVDPPMPSDPNPFALRGPAAPRRHSGYMADPAMWRTVDAIAGELAKPPASRPAAAAAADRGHDHE